MILPSREQQIILTHAAFIRQVVEFSRNPNQQASLEAILGNAAQQGWGSLVAALRQILKGQRDLGALGGLDEEDRVIAEAVLRGLQNPAALPHPQQQHQPQMAAPGLAHMIHAAATGNPQALILISNMAEQMSKAGGDMSRVAARIRPLINGERNPKKLCKKMSERGEQLMLGILDELRKLEGTA